MGEGGEGARRPLSPVGRALNDPVADRRPIAARQLGATVAVAGWLVRLGASPNAISLAGMACAVAAAVLFAGGADRVAPWLGGALLVQARLVANMLDGMVAVGRGVASPLGEVFNEVPDRVSDTAVFAGLGVAAGQPWLGLAVALAAMATAYVRVVGKACGTASDFCGPMAKQHRMAVVTAVAVWCAFAPPHLAQPVLTGSLWLVLILAAATAARRLARIARVLRGRA